MGLPPFFRFASLRYGSQMVESESSWALHFVTGNFLDRLPVFSQESCCKSFIDTLANLLDEWPCKLIAYVLMPDHTHLIVNPKDGRIKEFTGKLKSLSARAVVQTAHGLDFKFDPEESSHLVCQESFKATPLWSAWMIWQKINYIHANPVKAGLVNSAKDYRWSGHDEEQRIGCGGKENKRTAPFELARVRTRFNQVIKHFSLLF